jgi:hypothetical protein
LAVSLKGGRKRLLFRWYKLTSDLKSQEWVQALMQRQPPPLTIMGGSSSDLAIDLATQLRLAAARLADPAGLPLLFLTSATADEAGQADGPLTGIYPGRTFRFCFTNRQMAEAVTDFIWSRDDLRPDADPLYSMYWRDDRYSTDLNQRFVSALALREFRLDTHVSRWSPFSVGLFSRPNKWEQEGARDLIEVKVSKEYRGQKRPLLVVPATSQPTRRFLHALLRTAPREAGRFVVASGDGIAFNTVYRDREVAWPIQDLPFPLVFFCHRNPVDRAAGFVPETGSNAAASTEVAGSSAGTEDALLDVDMLESLVRARLVESCPPDVPPAEHLRRQLTQAGWNTDEGRLRLHAEGEPLFDTDGNRRSGTGEHVVYLKPLLRGEEVLPRSVLEIWAWHPQNGPGQQWTRREILAVEYEGAVNQEGDQ